MGVRMQLKALKRFSSRRPGDVFEASERMARVLKKIGRAVDHVEPEPIKRGPGRPPKVEAEPVVAEPSAPVEAAAEPWSAPAMAEPRHYRRRDMTAEEVK